MEHLKKSDSHLVEVTFAATSVGTKNAALRLRSSDPDASILDLTLAGTAIQQDIAVAPAAHDYGAVSIGASDSLTIVVPNDWTDTLRVDAPSLTGPDPSDYVIAAGGAAFLLAPADSHAITVTFAPATLGPKSATLLLASNDPDESLVEIPLSGIGTLAEIAASPAAHDYGDVLVGATATHSFVVRNEGTGALALTVAGLTGIDARAFAITRGAGTFAVAPGDSHLVDISFTPETPGPRVAALGSADRLTPPQFSQEKNRRRHARP